MSENAKTMTFVGVGILAVLLGLVSAPTSAEVDEQTLAGENLTKDFKEPDAAKRMRIVRYDEDTSAIREFEVAEQDNGLWTIPSKDSYPADAVRQMAEAATSLMDRKILSVASQNAGDHEQYGVIDPLSPKLEAGQKGVGTRVTMSDAQNKPLADLIVGKSVRNAEGQRYVRKAGQDVVYIIEIDPAKLSTNFEDWIEKDLLKLNSWDLQQVENKDYSSTLQLVMGPGGRPQIGLEMDQRTDMVLAYNDTDSKWTPVKLQQFEGKQGQDGAYVEFKLAEDEELNAETLNAMKTALDDLKIVDVRRKPQGLSENLKAGEDFMNNREALQDLISKGFAVTGGPDGGAAEIVSSDGELIATMKNGTEYVLRFGNLTNVAGSGEASEKPEEKPAAADPAKKDDKSDVHRYLFVMARFNKDAVKQPELVKLPDLPAGAQTEGKTDAAAPSENAKAAGETTPEAAAESAEKKDADATAKPGEKDAAKTADATKAEEKKAAEKDDAAAATGDAEPKDSAKADEGAEKKDDAAKTGEDAEKKDAAATKEGEGNAELDKVIAERKRIEQENQRKLDDYQALIKKGEQGVKDLNLRFGDWYFVVDDDVFKKVRVGRDKLIKKKDKKEGEGAAAPAAEGAAPPAGIPGLPPIPGATP